MNEREEYPRPESGPDAEGAAQGSGLARLFSVMMHPLYRSGTLIWDNRPFPFKVLSEWNRTHGCALLYDSSFNIIVLSEKLVRSVRHLESAGKARSFEIVFSCPLFLDEDGCAPEGECTAVMHLLYGKPHLGYGRKYRDGVVRPVGFNALFALADTMEGFARFLESYKAARRFFSDGTTPPLGWFSVVSSIVMPGHEHPLTDEVSCDGSVLTLRSGRLIIRLTADTLAEITPTLARRNDSYIFTFRTHEDDRGIQLLLPLDLPLPPPPPSLEDLCEEEEEWLSDDGTIEDATSECLWEEYADEWEIFALEDYPTDDDDDGDDDGAGDFGEYMDENGELPF